LELLLEPNPSLIFPPDIHQELKILPSLKLCLKLCSRLHVNTEYAADKLNHEPSAKTFFLIPSLKEEYVIGKVEAQLDSGVDAGGRCVWNM